MCVTVFVVPGDEDFHNMIVKHTYRHDDTHTSTYDDDDATMAQTTYATSSYIQHNPTSGIPSATLRAGIDLAGRSNNENDRPRLT